MSEETYALAGRSVYFAHPIDLRSIDQIQANQIAATEDDLTNAGAVVFRPGHAFGVPSHIEPHSFVQQVNREALYRADAVVACFPENSIGVPMEINQAMNLGKPLAILSSKWESSWALADTAAVRIHETGFVEWTEELSNKISSRAIDAMVADNELRYVGDERFAPTRGYEDDAGFDLYVAEHTHIPSGKVVDVPCGVKLELPPGCWGLVLGRSSTIRKHHLTVNPAVIDSGYRGDMFVAVHNTGDISFSANQGMRLGQIIPLPNIAETLVAAQVSKLSDGTRGDKGFGSSGR